LKQATSLWQLASSLSQTTGVRRKQPPVQFGSVRSGQRAALCKLFLTFTRDMSGKAQV